VYQLNPEIVGVDGQAYPTGKTMLGCQMTTKLTPDGIRNIWWYPWCS